MPQPYSYDRRPGVTADETTAAPKPKLRLIVPYDEREKVIHLLVEAHYIIKEWVIHSNPDFAMGHEYGATPATYKKVGGLRDELDELTEKIRHLHSSGV
jgi:hypothetical protein